MRGWITTLCLLSTFAAVAVHADAERHDRSQPAVERGFRLIESYTAGDHGGGAKNWAVTEDHRGVLYVANLAGVLEYDGEWWRIIPIANHSAARSVATLADGRVVVGGFDEIGILEAESRGRLAYRSLTPLLPNAARSFGEVWSIHAVTDACFFLTDRLLLSFDGERLQVVASLDPGEQLKAGFVVNGVYHLWTPEGLFTVNDGTLEPLAAGSCFAGRQPMAMLPLDEDRVLVAVRDGGLALWQGNRLTPFATATAQWLEAHEPRHGCRLDDGRIALASRTGGVLIIQPSGEVNEIIDGSTGLPTDEVLFCFSSSDGSLWLALDTGLVQVEASSPLSVFDRRAGLLGTINDVTRHRGRLHVATSRGIYTIRPAALQELTPATSGDQLTGVRQLTEIADGAWALQSTGDGLLVATSNGILDLQGGRARPIPDTAGVVFYCLERSRFRPHLVWAGGREGLWALQPGPQGWRAHGPLAARRAMVRSIVESAAHTVWAGTIFDGVLRFDLDDQQAQAVPQALRVAQVGSGEIGCFLKGDELILIAEDQLKVLDSDRHSLLQHPELGAAAEGLSFFLAATDSSGNVWLNSRPPAILRPQPTGRYAVDDRQLTAMPGRDIQLLDPDNDGAMWLASEDGLIRFDGVLPSDLERRPKALIRRVSLGSDIVYFGVPAADAPTSVPTLATTKGRLRIEYSAVTFHDGVQYQYRLDPADNEWSAWSSEPFTEFTNLWEGSYSFRLRSRGLGETLSDEATFSFRVLPPWYRSRISYASLGLLVLSSILLLSRLRHRSLSRRAEELEAQVTARTEELALTVAELRLAKRQVEEANLQLKEANSRLHELSIHDALTGVANRRHLDEALEREWLRAFRQGNPLSFILMDVDLFKTLNDRCGHPAGDSCLQRVAAALHGSLHRGGDLVARYGGDEFAFVLPETDLQGAVHLAEDLRSIIAGLQIPCDPEGLTTVTASFGVACMLPRGGGSTLELTAAADRALYRAKNEGRNRVIAASGG